MYLVWLKLKLMKELLEQIEKFRNSELPENMYDKLQGEILPGATVKVYWNDRRESDKGYIFVLPGQYADEGDAFVHVPQMDNSDGIGNGEEIYIHISEILTNERVKKVVVKGGFL
jgi:cold shock CspA family protein